MQCVILYINGCRNLGICVIFKLLSLLSYGFFTFTFTGQGGSVVGRQAMLGYVSEQGMFCDNLSGYSLERSAL